MNGESDAASVKSSHFLDVIEDCPTVQPTLEEFEDPVSLWGSLRALGKLPFNFLSQDYSWQCTYAFCMCRAPLWRCKT